MKTTRLARLLHGAERIQFLKASRVGAPERFKLSPNWQAFLSGLNSPEAHKFVTWEAAGWMAKDGTIAPQSYGGNVVRIVDQGRRFARLDSFRRKEAPPVDGEVSFITHPELISKVTRFERGRVSNGGAGLDAYIFLIATQHLYIPLNDLELFPDLPAPVTSKGTAAWLSIREEPSLSARVCGHLVKGSKDWVLDYAVRGSDVWGKVERGWIPLQLAAPKLLFPTTWSMRTAPPLPVRK